MFAEQLIEQVLGGNSPADVLDLFEAYKESDSYYKIKDNFPIKLIIKRWREFGQKIYDDSMPAWYSADEIWKYREYDWTRETARSGFAKVKGKSVELPGPLKWDALVADIKSRGWDKNDPLFMQIGDKRALVGEGNHRLAIARAANVKVPVTFHFSHGEPRLPARSKKRQDDEARMTRELQSKSIEKVVKKAAKTKTDPETERNVQDIMDILGLK